MPTRPQTPEHISNRVAGRRASGEWFHLDDIGDRIREGQQTARDAMTEEKKAAFHDRQAEVARRTFKGKKQSPEHIAARVAARKAKNGGKWFKVEDIGERISEGKKEAFEALPEEAKEVKREHARKAGKTRTVVAERICEREGCNNVIAPQYDRFCSTECKAIGQSGSGNPNWKGGKTKLSDKERHTYEYALWRYLVLARDNNRCQKCGATENLHAHHIKAWAEYPNLRLDVDNGITLCIPCHETIHGRSLNGKANGRYRIPCTCAWCGADLEPRPPWKLRVNNFCDNQHSALWTHMQRQLKKHQT